MKLLIIVTKYGNDEFNNYWCRANDQEFDLIPNKQNLLFLIKPNAFVDKSQNDKYYNKKDYWNLLKQKLIESINKNNFNAKVSLEIGIVGHGEVPNITNQFDELGNNIVFRKVYHSSTNELWKGAEYPATKCEGSLPLDKLRDAVCICKDSNYDKAFEEVWNFFLGDKELEAKLELLHQCLTCEGFKDSQIIFENLKSLLNGNNEKTKIETAFTEFKEGINNSKMDCFSDSYIYELEKLRKSLLE